MNTENLSKDLAKLYDESKIKTQDDFLLFYGKILSEISATLKEFEITRLIALNKKRKEK